MNELFNQIGKLPPHAIELEENVLGSLLTYEKYINEAIQILTPECFYNESATRHIINSKYKDLKNKYIFYFR